MENQKIINKGKLLNRISFLKKLSEEEKILEAVKIRIEEHQILENPYEESYIRVEPGKKNFICIPLDEGFNIFKKKEGSEYDKLLKKEKSTNKRIEKLKNERERLKDQIRMMKNKMNQEDTSSLDKEDLEKRIEIYEKRINQINEIIKKIVYEFHDKQSEKIKQQNYVQNKIEEKNQNNNENQNNDKQKQDVHNENYFINKDYLIETFCGIEPELLPKFKNVSEEKYKLLNSQRFILLEALKDITTKAKAKLEYKVKKAIYKKNEISFDKKLEKIESDIQEKERVLKNAKEDLEKIEENIRTFKKKGMVSSLRSAETIRRKLAGIINSLRIEINLAKKKYEEMLKKINRKNPNQETSNDKKNNYNNHNISENSEIYNVLNEELSLNQLINSISKEPGFKIGKKQNILTIKKIENELNLKLGNQYKNFILKYGQLYFNNIQINGVMEEKQRYDLINLTKEARVKYNIPNDYFVALLNDYLLILVDSNDKVYKFNTEKKELEDTETDFEGFIYSIIVF